MKYLSLLIVALLLMAAPMVVAAQEATPQPEVTVDATVVIVGLFVVLIAFVIQSGIVNRQSFVEISKQAPAFLVEGVLSATSALLGSANSIVSRTPSTLDDAALAELKRELTALRSEIEASRDNADG